MLVVDAWLDCIVFKMNHKDKQTIEIITFNLMFTDILMMPAVKALIFMVLYYLPAI